MTSCGTTHPSAPFIVVYLHLQHTVLLLFLFSKKPFCEAIYISFLKTQVPLLARKAFNLHNKVSIYIMYSYRLWVLLTDSV